MNLVQRRQQPFRARSFSGIDLLLILLSFVVCHFLYLDGLDFSSERLVIVVATLGLGYVVFAVAGLYRTNRNLLLHNVVSRLTIGWFVVVMLVTMLAYLSKIAVEVSRVWFGLSTLLAYGALISARLVSGMLLAISHKHGLATVSIVVLGEAAHMDSVLERLKANVFAGYKVARVFTKKAQSVMSPTDHRDVEELITELSHFVEEQRQLADPVSEVWIALPLSQELVIKSLIDNLRNSSVDVCIVPDAFGMQVISGTSTSIADIPVVNVSDIRLPGSAELFKRIFDRVVALVAVLVLSPVLLVIAVWIKLDSTGPILFRQHRYGVGGKEIDVWKFRSMTVVENQGAVKQATRNDVRVTKVGSILRRHSLDELPQFFNVLQGSMSIVGPRPHAVSHNEEYRGKIDGYMMRHKIKPGITGWAQVNGWRGETDTLEKMEKRVRYDLEYIRNWSVWLDLKIIALTVIHVFSGSDAY